MRRRRAPTAALTWINCGHPSAYLVGTSGELEELEGAQHGPLGTGGPDPRYETNKRQLQQGERLILVTNGITERKMENGGRFGSDGLRRALEHAHNPTAPSTAMAIQEAVTACWREPLEDDGTVVVMAVE